MQANDFVYIPLMFNKYKSMLNAESAWLSFIFPAECMRAGSMWQCVWTGGGVWNNLDPRADSTVRWVTDTPSAVTNTRAGKSSSSSRSNCSWLTAQTHFTPHMGLDWTAENPLITDPPIYQKEIQGILSLSAGSSLFLLQRFAWIW